jgi:hypothetical protein
MVLKILFFLKNNTSSNKVCTDGTYVNLRGINNCLMGTRSHKTGTVSLVDQYNQKIKDSNEDDLKINHFNINECIKNNIKTNRNEYGNISNPCNPSTTDLIYTNKVAVLKNPINNKCNDAIFIDLETISSCIMAGASKNVSTTNEVNIENCILNNIKNKANIKLGNYTKSCQYHTGLIKKKFDNIENFDDTSSNNNNMFIFVIVVIIAFMLLRKKF